MWASAKLEILNRRNQALPLGPMIATVILYAILCYTGMTHAFFLWISQLFADTRDIVKIRNPGYVQEHTQWKYHDKTKLSTTIGHGKTKTRRRWSSLPL